MNKIINLFLFSTFLSLISKNSHAQNTITNKSFEGPTADATMPSGWSAQSEGTTPDILPGFWGVYLEPADGDSYLGLINRQNGSFESIGQRLESVLQKDNCYTFEISLAFSDNYSGYNNPLHLRVWITNKKGKREQMVFQSPLILNLNWKTFEVEFIPKSDMKYIILEAFIPSENKSYKGNILIDNMTNISLCHRA